MNTSNQSLGEFQQMAEYVNEATAIIAEKERAAVDVKRQIAEIKNTIDVVRRDVELDVAMELDEKGKATYGNADARKAAAAARMNQLDNARQLQRSLNAAENTLAMLDVERDSASRNRQNQLAFLNYLASWNLYHMPSALTMRTVPQNAHTAV